MTNLPSIGVMPTTPLDTAAANTYTDVNALASLKKDPDSPEAVHAVAKQVEALFLQMMLKSMRDATDEVNHGSNEMSTYNDMFDKQVALSISQHADLGIGRLLKRQLKSQTAPVISGSAASTLGTTPAEFVRTLTPSVRRAAATLGLNPTGLMAQAALETGWGQRMPRNADGSSSHNLFGIKAGEDWHGARASSETVEVVNGVAAPRRATFRAYRSVDESVADFAKLLQTSPRYKDALAAGTDAQAYIGHMAKAGYATDPEYSDKLNRILASGTIQAALAARVAKL